jgi:hypothetical protein
MFQYFYDMLQTFMQGVGAELPALTEKQALFCEYGAFFLVGLFCVLLYKMVAWFMRTLVRGV